MDRAYLDGVHLESAYLSGTRVERAHLMAAHLERTDLFEAHLEGANLVQAHLDGALSDPHLEGANLSEAHLEGADTRRAHLERAYLLRAHLERPKLSGAYLTLYPDESGRFSEYACGTPLRWPPTGLPGPPGRGVPRRASSRFKPTGTRLERTAPRPRRVAAFTHGNDLPWNAVKQHAIGKVQGVLSSILAQAGETGNGEDHSSPA
jgi:hypothetical protein